MTQQPFKQVFRAIACFVCIAGVGAGCANSTPTPLNNDAIPAAAKTPIDVCALFTAQDIEQILGKGFVGKNNSTLSDFVCDYQTAARKDTVSVTVRRLSSSSEATNWYELLEANKDKSKIQPVSGLGDKAEFIPDSMIDSLAAHKGNIVVSVVNSTFDDEKFLTVAQRMAQQVLETVK